MSWFILIKEGVSMKKYFPIILISFIFASFFCFKFFLIQDLKKEENNNLYEKTGKSETYSNEFNKINEESYLNDSPMQVVDEPKPGKEVFLTFDDGPCSNNTPKILDILKDNNVRATFFVVGTKGEENPQILKELSDNGMSIGVHTYSHKYSEIYKNTDSYLKDYYNCQKVISKITGRDPISYVRMPGGSDNLVANKNSLNNIKNVLKEKELKYVDWNVSSGDAESTEVAAEDIKKNVITQCKNKKLAVILMHDTYYKNSTVKALPYIVKYLKDEGFVFKTFDDITQNEEAQMVRMRVINRVSI